METFQKQLHLPVTRIDDSKRMLALLKVSSNSPICINTESVAPCTHTSCEVRNSHESVLVFAMLCESSLACSVRSMRQLRPGQPSIILGFSLT